MERFNDVLNRIYNKDFRDMEPDGITYGLSLIHIQMCIRDSRGDIVGAKLKEQEAILNQVAANSLDGSLEFYKEMLRNMSASLKEIQSIKYRKDRGEAISAEEQIALDKGESLLANADYFRCV